MQQRTYETRLPADPGQDAIFDAYADLYGRAERALFARLAAGDALVALKRTFLTRFGLDRPPVQYARSRPPRQDEID